MLDLIVRNAALPDGRTGQDIGCKDGRIVELRPRSAGRGGQEHRRGRPAGPRRLHRQPFPHGRDLSYGRPRVNQSGTLLEGIALWSN